MSSTRENSGIVNGASGTSGPGTTVLVDRTVVTVRTSVCRGTVIISPAGYGATGTRPIGGGNSNDAR